MSHPFDLFIAAAPKDYHKLPYVVGSALEYVEGIDGVYICTPDTPKGDVCEDTQRRAGSRRVWWYDDQQVLFCNLSRFKYRPTWIYQQQIKLLQQVTVNEWYMVIDADVVINRTLRMWEGGHPVWHIGNPQNHAPYYRFNKRVLGYERQVNHTFLADMGFYSKRHAWFLHKNHLKKIESVDFINARCHPSEADLYMNYMCHEHKGLYRLRWLRTAWHGATVKEGSDYAAAVDMEEKVRHLRQTEYDTFAFHTYLED